MITNILRLFAQACLGIFIVCILSFALTSIAFAEIGDSKSQIEEKYGEYSLVQDKFHRIRTPDEWKSVSSDGAKTYGYMTTNGEMNVTVWIEYNKQNQVVKETVIMDGSIKIRDFQNHFPELYNSVAAPDSSVFVTKTLSKRNLEVIIRKIDNKFNLIRFFMDKSDENTAINMHSKMRGFEIEEITSEDVNQYIEKSKLAQSVAKARGQQGYCNDSWLRTDNYFQDKLFFSENLVSRKKTDMIVIHHTAFEDMSVADIHEMHLKNGWAGIGYHKVILSNATVENGRPISMIGAHAQGENQRSIGIALVGNFEISPPSPVQMDVLVKLTLELMNKYNIPLENVLPHREATKGTLCPGKFFPWEEFIQRLKSNRGETKVAF